MVRSISSRQSARFHRIFLRSENGRIIRPLRQKEGAKPSRMSKRKDSMRSTCGRAPVLSSRAYNSLADASRAVHLARLVTPRRKPEIRPDIARPGEPGGRIHSRAIADRDNEADTRRRHQLAAHHVVRDGFQNRRAAMPIREWSGLVVRNFLQQIVCDSLHLCDSIVYDPVPFDASLEADGEISNATELHILE